MFDISLLERLYKSYGFEVSHEVENLPVFIYRKSRYFGVDILLLDQTKETKAAVKRVKEKYSKIGFAVNEKSIKSNDDAELELFKSFFSFDSTIERIKRKYNDFQKKQTKSLFGNQYEYVESPFELQNHDLAEGGIFDIIRARFLSDKPELLILEAAAGYGKTCTAFEVLKKVSENPNNQIPIFTELSRNRAAKIFRYILLDEIDLEYPSLNSELVIKEIKNGRIPLIIDGFDELLEKVSSESLTANGFEEVETMLDTIGSLLEYKTKIILTTRKTAIFTGLEFEAWLGKWNNKFNLTRISLKEPRIKDWLGNEKFTLTREKGIPIQYLANPVILTFLKNISFSDFEPLMANPEMLVQHYFDKMLEREKERQSLIMTVETQIEVFTNVARMLIELDSTVEDKDFFKQMILSENRKIIESTRILYSGAEKPTLENLVDKLATHALLDRKGRDQGQIGFVNDFVFGTLIGQIISKDEIINIEKLYSAYMIELAVTAFRVQSIHAKNVLWEKIQHVLNKFNSIGIFTFDIYLKNKLQRPYSEISVSDLTFFNVNFSENLIDSSVFVNCYFKNCSFENTSLKWISFINCTFDNCSVVDSHFLDDRNGITAIKCIQKRCSILIDESNNYEAEKSDLVSDIEKEILEKLWSISNTKGHHIVKLTNCFVGHKKRKISKSLKSMEGKGLITVSGIYVHFVLNKIPIIKEILQIGNEI